MTGEILSMSAPLLYATLGALVTDHAGVLAVFLDGAITFSAFVCVAVASATGSPALGVLAAAASSVLLLALIARFDETTGANPFITGLAFNLLAAGLTSWLSVVIFGTRGVVALPGTVLPAAHGEMPFGALFAVLPFAAAIALAFVLRRTTFGLALRATGSDPDFLAVRGLKPTRYRIASWGLAALFAAAAGSTLALGLGAWVPNISAGRGWTALAACYLGNRDPIACIGACLLFSLAEYLSNALQGTGAVPATLILGFPYVLALVAFIAIPARKK
jgi:ABC-type uncharacterized transport system permease subunit